MIAYPDPMPALAGLGIHVRRVDAVRGNGDRVTFVGEDMRFVESRHGRYFAEADDLPEPVELDPAHVAAAAGAFRNLTAAAVHAARHNGPTVLRIFDDEWACAVARALSGGVA